MACIAQLANVLQSVIILTDGEKMLLTPPIMYLSLYKKHQIQNWLKAI